MADRANQWRPWLVVAVALSALAGCSGERTFDAEGIVSDLNAVGAGLVLGESLPSTDEDVEVHVVSFSGAEPDPAGEDATAGAVVILDDADKARAEFARCESAISFTCFRAANTVLRFTGLDQVQARKMTTALAGIAEGSEPGS